MSIYSEEPVQLVHVTESGKDLYCFENKWFEIRIGDSVIGSGETLKEAFEEVELWEQKIMNTK